jgi:hypothetical protein
MAFKADFNIENEGIHANEKCLFKNSSQVGLIIDSDYLQIDGDIDKSQLDLSNYLITSISKIQWAFSDGNFYNSDEVVHRFKESKTEYVSLTIWSEAFSFGGKTFYFTYKTTKEVIIQSRFYKFIKDKYPIYDDVSSPELDDLIKGAGKFFDRLHSDVSSLSSLIDVHRIEPELLEYWALTLGHSNYVKKVGYDLNTNDFENYDILDKIKLNEATEKEINTLRNFILFSADFFKNKGTSENIINFLRFFGIESKVKDLWTKTWGVLLKESVSENFIGLENFEDNKLKLKWENINITNHNNAQSFLDKKFNSIVLNSYNFVETFEYPRDSVATISTSGDKFNWVEFELSNNNGISSSPAIIKSIKRTNGDNFIQVENDDFSELFDIVPNEPVRYDANKQNILQISGSLIDESNSFSVVYDLPKENKSECILASVTEKVKDFDLRVKFKIKQENTKTNLYRSPDNELFVLFRGIKSLPNDDFNDYYKFSLNTDRKTFSLCKVIFSDSVNDYLTQHISLSYDNDEIFEPAIIYPEGTEKANEIFEFNKEKEYELLVMVNGSILSAYVRENINENSVNQNISNFSGDNNISNQVESDWIPLIQNFSFNVQPRKVKTVDVTGNEIYAENYSVTSKEGFYGIGVRDGIVEFNEVTLNNLDADETLYNKLEKELKIKPKFLEELVYYETRADNYEETKKSFIKEISKDFKTNESFPLTVEESQSLSNLIVDKAPVSQNIGTRFVVDFNKEWVESNFESNESVVDKIVIPFGKQYAWVLPEQKIVEGSNYDINASPSLLSDISSCPAFFSADLSTILDDYHLEPLDTFSGLTRKNIDSLSLGYSQKLQTYANSNNNNFQSDGVWEEIYPYSNKFETLDADITLDDSSTFINRMLSPITVSTSDGERVIGVVFKNCDYIKALISRYGNEFNKDVMIWGSFTFHVPCNTLNKKPSNIPLERSEKFPGHYKIVVFLPLGVLNESITNYSLGREYVHQGLNTPSLIDLNGIFAKLDADKVNLNTNSVTIKTRNQFESIEKGLTVRYFASGVIKLTTSLELSKSNDPKIRDSIFSIEENHRNFFETLKTEDDINWWIPKELWRKRDFELQQVNLDEDIVSGINYVSKSLDENNTTKLFYGKEIPTSSDNIKSLNIKLTDGRITPNTLYYAKVKIKINYSGMSDDVVSFISESERNNLKIGGKKYEDGFKTAPVNLCKEFYIPLSFYDKSQLKMLIMINAQRIH